LVKGNVQQKIATVTKIFKLDSDQYGENRERGPSAFGEEFDLLLKSDPD
jgi:hypothetical protein